MHFDLTNKKLSLQAVTGKRGEGLKFIPGGQVELGVTNSVGASIYLSVNFEARYNADEDKLFNCPFGERDAGFQVFRSADIGFNTPGPVTINGKFIAECPPGKSWGDILEGAKRFELKLGMLQRS